MFQFSLHYISSKYKQHVHAKDQKKKFKSQTMDPVNITEYGLLDEDVGIVELNKKNFKKLVTPSHDAWIVVVYKHGLEVLDIVSIN